MGKIVVVGSLNIDLVTEAERFPLSGETILGQAFYEFPGGKGANQAVAAARLGAEVMMIGCIGKDIFGERVKENLMNEKIDCTGVLEVDDVQTGIAQITVANDNNSIVVVPGANAALSIDWIQKQEHLMKEADMILLQLEIPLDAVRYVIEFANAHQISTILNPAPIQKLSVELLKKVDYLTPNESEFTHLVGCSEELFTEDTFLQLKEKGLGQLVVTRGENGVSFWNEKEQVLKHSASQKVEVVDTTGAGDTFNGALAVHLSEGKSLVEAIDLAVLAAAFSVTKTGAQSGMPTREEILEFFKE
ncbi:ribokinase [Alkalihalobacillus sp. 1P02AB]|uniref:ribokinase n=1 Tax=Alkalihalobacillus sp. 1P02AB TaxID=3132260 RepID=UPI0039A52883